MARGNHKSATGDQEYLEKLLSKDVYHGFSFQVEADKVKNLEGSMVQPAGLAEQHGIKSDGTRFLKKRLTHNLTFSITGDDMSVNNRVDLTQYPEMVYGWCLVRVVHFLSLIHI